MTNEQAPRATPRRRTPVPPMGSSPSASEDTAVEEIPGLGPIRARALMKAGYRTISLLRAASTAEIGAVPGMTDVKASQLCAYLRGEADRVGGPTPAPQVPPVVVPADAPRAKPQPAPRTRAARATPAAPKAAPKAMPKAVAAPVSFSEPPLAIAAHRVSATVEELLRGAAASTFERGFARQLGKVATLAERIAHEAAGGTDRERITGQLRKVLQLIEEISTADSLSTKRQERFADDLRDRRHKIQEAVGESDRDSAPAPKQDVPAPAAAKDKADNGAKKTRRGR
jgi:hypothetical protein